MDNEQFKFGQALRPKSNGCIPYLTEAIKKTYLTKIRGFNLNYICVATILFEGKYVHIYICLYIQVYVYSIFYKNVLKSIIRYIL